MPGGGASTGGSSGGGGLDYGSLFGAAGDLLSGFSSYLGSQSQTAGYAAEAAGYDQEMQGFITAEQLEDQNITEAAVSGKIQDIQTQRKIYMSESGTRSDVATAGLAESGNALDILRSSAEQGALTIGMQDTQTAINENNYREQALAYHMEATQAGSEANAARSAASAAQTGGILGGIGGILKAGAALAPLALAVV